LAEALSQRRGQQVLVENAAGGEGLVAANALLRARPGEALMYSFGDLVTVPPAISPGYDLVAELVPVARTTANPLVLAAAVQLGVRDLAGIMALARQKPGELGYYASPGGPALGMRALQREAGVTLVKVPYRSSAAAMVDLTAGRIALLLAPQGAALELVAAGKVVAVATPGPMRSPELPEMPTSAEAGFPAFKAEGSQGIFAARTWPEAEREALAAQVLDALRDPTVLARLAAAGVTAQGRGPAEFAAYLAETRERLAILLREFGPE
jgi:tripartite-type tricarboxylate transporter receptor subunit TctC